ncbi:MAG: DNA polymerase ligase N-terminal domain-containing protein [Nitrososphaerales archaeon]
MPRFVVHEHWASHHHFDFRLEMDGVLKSWAVPKGPPSEPGVKRLAIEVEDHPLEYADFEGMISKGEYGAGKVEIWDRGSYMLKTKTPREIQIELKGKKLNGDFTLFLIKDEKGRRQWLLFKRRTQDF